MKKMQIPSQEIWCEALSPTSLTNLGAVLKLTPEFCCSVVWSSVDLAWELVGNRFSDPSPDDLRRHLHFNQTPMISVHVTV